MTTDLKEIDNVLELILIRLPSHFQLSQRLSMGSKRTFYTSKLMIEIDIQMMQHVIHEMDVPMKLKKMPSLFLEIGDLKLWKMRIRRKKKWLIQLMSDVRHLQWTLRKRKKIALLVVSFPHPCRHHRRRHRHPRLQANVERKKRVKRLSRRIEQQTRKRMTT